MYCPSRSGKEDLACPNWSGKESSTMREPSSLCNPANRGTTCRMAHGRQPRRRPWRMQPRSSVSRSTQRLARPPPASLSMEQSKPQPNCENCTTRVLDQW
eukprot:719409-Amphidinium_carterae.2